ENTENLDARRIVGAPEKGGNIEPGILARSKRCGWTDYERVLRIATRVFNGEVLVFHFDPDLELLARHDDRSDNTLGKAPFTAAVQGIFFLEESVHCPFESTAKLLGQKQPELISVRSLGRPAFLIFPRRRSRTFFMPNGTGAEFVFREQGWIQRDLVPVGQGITRFNTGAGRSAATMEA